MSQMTRQFILYHPLNENDALKLSDTTLFCHHQLHVLTRKLESTYFQSFLMKDAVLCSVMFTAL